MDPSLQPFADRIREAAAARTPLRIRGGGSKDFHADTLAGDVLATGSFAGIVAWEPSELYVTARAGTPLAELEALLATQGQCLPFEPPHFGGGATVGGMVAAGLSGPARASAGSVRDFVLGVTMLNGRGEALVFGGQVMKNVAGYDVSRLMVGTWGTLGLLAEVSLKVLPVAPAEATLRFAMGQAEALRRLNEWGGRPLPLNASHWQEDGAGGVLEVRLRGAVAAVEAACRALGGERVADAGSRAAWVARRDLATPWCSERGGRDLWRLSVPQVAPVLQLPEPPVVEWHGGQRWVRAERGEAARIRDAAQAAGGHATLFMAGDAAHPPPRGTALPAPLARIHLALQREFDPAGIFNPGRLGPV